MDRDAADQPKFQRLEADERREALILATIRCLARIGARATSVREICAEAGVSPGLLRHYFDGKDDLVVQTYDYLTTKVNQRCAEILDDESFPPEERLSHLFVHILKDEWVTDEMLGVWVAFWSLQRSDPKLADAHRRYNQDFRQHLENTLIALTEQQNVNTDAHLMAISLSALLDGLWLELCLDPDGFSSDQAIVLCQSWLDGFLGQNVHRRLAIVPE
ncbi:TetR/AcrR family transcriptional regulator [Aestuariispira ectoiniformans]|uniref:TetR/AcrR family transcriptional regulator n=1 Tax=Aestuariispira ectoiniformans TaxID=2775080 RepID=UPI00223BF6FA|nr:TetR family transcriptional regulator C-terminal domain-containing protein [Aestuariispira ectoiniformans]